MATVMSDEDDKPAEKPAGRRRAKSDGEICSACWPGGWPETAHHASCVHGNYKR